MPNISYIEPSRKELMAFILNQEWLLFFGIELEVLAMAIRPERHGNTKEGNQVIPTCIWCETIFIIQYRLHQ